MPETSTLTTEEDRLAALADLAILDTPRESRFDRVTRLAARLLWAPIAAVSLVDRDRVWFKSSVGLEAEEIRRDQALCNHVIRSPWPLIIPDASQDPRFANLPMVAGPPHIRFYLGVPLRAPGGQLVGAFCVLSPEPREPTEDQVGLVRELAQWVEGELAETELNRAMRSLQLADRRWKDEVARFFQLSLELLGIMGPDGHLRQVNPAWERVTGWSTEELTSRHLDEFLPPGCTWITDEQRARLAEGGELVEWDFQVRCKDGRPIWLRWRANALPEEQLIYLVGQEVTRQREVERMKDEFVSVVSHELRTPMTAIRGALGLLTGGALGPLPEKGQRLLEIALTNTERLVRLVNDILDLERMEAGQVLLFPSALPVPPVLDLLVQSLKPTADREGISLQVRAEDCEVWADSDRLQQLLTNLVSNAIKFSPAGSRVEVEASRRGAEVHFLIRDYGRGIPREQLSRVFDRFAQVDASDARVKGGSGLGLHICKRLVDQHGGTIGVESQPGRGSTFWFTLPVPRGTA